MSSVPPPVIETPPPALGDPAEATWHSSARKAADPRSYNAFLPLLLLGLAVLLWSGFQSYELYKEQQSLTSIYVNQQRQMDDSAKLRAALDSLARDTVLLANSGNINAKLMVDQLKKRGVTINPDAPAPAPTP